MAGIAVGDRVRYILNERDDLSRLDDLRFDFIYTSITLQHMEPRYSLNYIKEFLRLLKPGGGGGIGVPATFGEDGVRQPQAEAVCKTSHAGSHPAVV
ncbi:MAG: class I SAM-dependent methyltransferase [Clostridia bacterium]|nr:MAG: class I SAM-dependent methyltransferase [Clostridia bacterium]